MDNLLVNFLRKLWQTDRKAFIVISAFLVLQVGLSLIKLEVTPVFLYGMYSENIPATDTFSQLKIYINDQPLENYQPSFRQKALLTTTIANYEAIRENNNTDILKTRLETKYPGLQHHLIYPVFGESIYNSASDLQAYKKWFRKKCLDIAGSERGTVAVVKHTYIYNATTQQLSIIKKDTLENY